MTISSGNYHKSGHTYMFVEWEGDEIATKSTNDCKVTVILRDLTAGKLIKRRGVIKLAGMFGAIWLDSLEGYKNVYVGVDHNNIPCKIKKDIRNSITMYSLMPL